jgi:lipid II:glycine glycyltransferase (peptidoglycan interpeptide bridge formation enzyme)
MKSKIISKLNENFFCNQNLQKALKKSNKIRAVYNNKHGSFLIYPLFKKFTIIYTNAHPNKKVKNYLKKLSKKYNCIYAISENLQEIEKFQQKSFKEFIPRATRKILLTDSQEEILANMHSKGRYNAKVAQKKGLKVTNQFILEDFYELLSQTAQRDAFNINDKKYFEELFKNIPKNQIHYYSIYHQEKLIAASIVIDHAKTAYYFYGASNHKYRNLMAPYLIQHTAIFDAKKRKLTHYDFLGISPYSPHPLDKVSDFKRKFGGTVTHYTKNKLTVFKPFLFAMLYLRKTLKNFIK